MLRLPEGSTPAEGSSRMTVLEPPTNATATDNFRCMPPDKFFEKSFFFGLKPVSSSIFSSSFSVDFLSRPFSLAKNHKCSLTVKCGKSTLCWGTKPSDFRIESIDSVMSMSSIRAVPDVGEYSPVSKCMVVLFPAPLWPRKAEISFW
ncbi:hypothetical protein BpHYR1_020786 [Brachionus plicatilis]|uniref:Uncharacterized protein n=1 Tax=Brachionus plicatilis TaxID=10195 RepID=A0A3M7S8E7_BRAPC|nr:hypothetical protein BpHYR1_020786 [Brachionus plicatilis]